MSTALAVLNNELLSMWENPEKLKEIRKLVCATPLTDLEFEYLVGIGRSTLLNPFLREVWAVKYGNSAAQIFIGRDGYRKAAQRHPEYEYHQPEAVYENDDFQMMNGEIRHAYRLKDRGELMGAYCVVKRKSSSKPTYVWVDFKEYSTEKSLWAKTGKPATMIKKVAEAQALRSAFQDILAGTYAEEERFDNQESQESHGRVIEGTSQTETIKNILKEREVIDVESGEVLEERPIFNTGRDDLPISEEQIKEIEAIMDAKGLTEARKKKAFELYKVQELNQLTDAQARLFLLQLGRV